MTEASELLRLVKARIYELQLELSHLHGLLECYGDTAQPFQSVRRTGGNTRGLSTQWIAMLHFIGMSPDGVNYAAMESFSLSQGLNVTREAMRMQMHRWRRDGIIHTPAPGHHALTDAGRALLGGGNSLEQGE